MFHGVTAQANCGKSRRDVIVYMVTFVSPLVKMQGGRPPLASRQKWQRFEQRLTRSCDRVIPRCRPACATVARSLIPLIFLLAACRSSSDGPVRIGAALSITETGTVPMKRAAELAVAEINQAGGINGRPLELVLRDDFADPDSAVAVAQELYDSDVSPE